MKPLKDLQEISRMLAAAPDFPAPNGTTSTVQAEVLLNRLEQLLLVGMGLPVAAFFQNDGVFLKLCFSKLGEEANVFVPTPRAKEFMEELKGKIIGAI